MADNWYPRSVNIIKGKVSEVIHLFVREPLQIYDTYQAGCQKGHRELLRTSCPVESRLSTRTHVKQERKWPMPQDRWEVTSDSKNGKKIWTAFGVASEMSLQIGQTGWGLKGESVVEWHLYSALGPNPNTASFTKPFLSPFKLQKSPSCQAFSTSSLAFKSYCLRSLQHACLSALSRMRTSWKLGSCPTYTWRTSVLHSTPGGVIMQ